MNGPTRPDTTQSTRFRTLLGNCRDMVLVFLSAQINELFSNTDDALMSFAERAESNAMQGRFFEAMSAIRRNRAKIEHRFREQVDEGFAHFGNPPQTADGELGEMRLVERDDMEESVATENLVARCRSKYYGEIYALAQRMAVLNNGHKVAEEDIPGGPGHLVTAFRTAIAELPVDVKAKIVLYALYEKFVLRQLKGLYDELNTSLKKAGVLPNLKPAIMTSEAAQPPHVASRNERPEVTRPPRAEHRGEPARESTIDTEDERESARDSLGTELFDSILSLLATRRTHRGPATGGTAAAARAGEPGRVDPGTGSGPPPAGTADPGQSAYGGGEPANEQAHRHLLDAIDRVRPLSAGTGIGVLSDIDALPQVAVDPGFLDKLKGALAHEREMILSQVEGEQLPGIDADTIDLIGMLFEYMLNDPLLPNVAKALLSHLHTPYLKLSLTDRQLLVDSEHPARLLLDLLVEAGGQWVYENDVKRGIFPHMQTAVDRVLQESAENPALFPELLEYFRAAMEEQRRKSNAIEQRAQESVKGRERLHASKQRAAREMRARVEKTPLPKPARRFLTQAWTDRLVFLLLRHPDGELSAEWEQALKVADELVWLFDPVSTRAKPETIERACRSVSVEIDNALDSLGGYHQHYLEELRRMLREPATIAAWHVEHADAAYSDPLETDSDSLAESSSTPRRDAAETDEPSRVEPPAAETLSPAETKMLERLHQLKFGTWFAFPGPDGVRKLKLSWLSPLTATCMFVDRSGIQAEVKPLVEVARAMVAGRIKLIARPQHQFVQRALLAIRRRLQNSMEATD